MATNALTAGHRLAGSSPLRPVTSCEEAIRDVRPGYADLIVATDARDDPVTLAFAGVIGLACLRVPPYDVSIAGLDRCALSVLAHRFFPYLPTSLDLGDGTSATSASRGDEFSDLVTLLCEHRTVANVESTWLAHAVATACMEGNHLWQDMGLQDRGVLSALLHTHFAPLARRNTGDMKWKKFFYRELCLRADVLACKSPTCDACIDYTKCFGPEV